MRSLTEQVTFKVSSDMLASLQERGRQHGLDANPFARKLVEEALATDRAEHLADELRELLGLLRPIASQLTGCELLSASADSQTASDQIRQMNDLVSQAAKQFAHALSSVQSDIDSQLQPISMLANQLAELRADLNKSFAALLHYQMGFSVEDAQRWVDARMGIKEG